MTAHTEHHERTTGARLLPIFALATVIATIAICFVVAVPSTIALVVALGMVIAFAAGIVALLQPPEPEDS